MTGFSVVLDATRMDAMLADFASIEPDIEFRDIVVGVAIRVSAGAMRRTRSADASKIKHDFEDREWTTLDGKKYKLSWYLHNESLWSRIQAHRAVILSAKLGSRGLAKQSFVQLATKLGGTIVAPGYVQNAVDSQHQRTYPEDVAVQETGQGGSYQLTIINSSPLVQRAGGAIALQAAMNAESKYFYTLLEKRAFSSYASRAAKYPSIYIQPGLAA